MAPTHERHGGLDRTRRFQDGVPYKPSVRSHDHQYGHSTHKKGIQARYSLEGMSLMAVLPRTPALEGLNITFRLSAAYPSHRTVSRYPTFPREASPSQAHLRGLSRVRTGPSHGSEEVPRR